MRSRFLSSVALLLMGMVGIPADSQTFPSLARRPVESRDFDAEQRAADLQKAEQDAAGACVPVGVVVQARTREFLDLAVVTDPAWLAARAPSADAELLARYLEASRLVCRGDAAAARAGHAVALAPPSERFHWVTAPRSDVLQCAPVHGGLCDDPAAELARLFALYVDAPGVDA